MITEIHDFDFFAEDSFGKYLNGGYNVLFADAPYYYAVYLPEKMAIVVNVEGDIRVIRCYSKAEFRFAIEEIRNDRKKMGYNVVDIDNILSNMEPSESPKDVQKEIITYRPISDINNLSSKDRMILEPKVNFILSYYPDEKIEYFRIRERAYNGNIIQSISPHVPGLGWNGRSEDEILYYLTLYCKKNRIPIKKKLKEEFGTSEFSFYEGDVILGLKGISWRMLYHDLVDVNFHSLAEHFKEEVMKR